MKRLWVNRRFLNKRSWQIAGSVYAVIGLAGLLANLDDLNFPSLAIGIRVIIGIAILFALWIVILLICCIYFIRKDKITVLNVLNNHHVFVQYGDLFSEKIIYGANGMPSAEKRNIVIPVNCCFDTIVDDDLIAARKIHGIALNNLYGDGIYTQEGLNRYICENLQSRGIPFTELTINEKRKGNLKRFPFGTIVEVDVNKNITYFLIALTEFNSDLHATIKKRENYIVTLQRLIEYISTRSQGYPTVMPIIGGGLPEISDSELTMLELMIKLINLNKDKINCDIHIVVRESGKTDIPIFSL